MPQSSLLNRCNSQRAHKPLALHSEHLGDNDIQNRRAGLFVSVVFENRVLRRIFGPKTDEVTGEWRKLHNEELNGLYSLPNIVQVIKSIRLRWAGHVARMGEWRGVYRVLVGKPEGMRPLGRPRRR
jgi:hypothetical protein